MSTTESGTQAVRIGTRTNGQPIYLIQGGAPDGDPAPGDQDGQQDPGKDGQQDQSQADKTGQQTEPQDVASLPKWARDELISTRREAAANRTGKTAAETEAQQAKALVLAVQKALGQTEDGKPDPEKLAADLVAAQAAQRTAAIELQVYRLASKTEANPDAVLDSRSFVTKVEGLDPNAQGFADKVETAIKDALTANPLLKAAPQAGTSGASGTDMNGNTGKDKKPGSLEEAITNQLVKDQAAQQKTR